MYNQLFFIIRILTIVPLIYLVIKQGSNVIKRQGLNGLSKTRRTLLICTFTVLLRQSLYFVGDIHVLFLNHDKHVWLSEIQGVLLIVNLTIFYAVLSFYGLFYKSKTK